MLMFQEIGEPSRN